MRPRCLKCGSTNVSIERRPDGLLRCLDCGQVWTRAEEDQAVIRDLREQLDTLRVGKGPFCSYCYESFPGGTWEQLQAHIRTCEKHPMHTLLVEARGLIKRLDLDQLDHGTTEPHPWAAGLREAVQRATNG